MQIPLIIAGGGAGHPDNYCPLHASLNELPLGIGAANGIGYGGGDSSGPGGGGFYTDGKDFCE